MRASVFKSALLAGAVILGVAGCTDNRQPQVQQVSLYERLGGKPAIEAVVDQFIANVAADRQLGDAVIAAQNVLADILVSYPSVASLDVLGPKPPKAG